MKTRVVSLASTWLLLVHAGVAAAQGQQPVPAGRSLDLASLQQAAIAADPRLEQLGLLDAQSALRQRNISAARLPSIGVDGQGQYQSDVPRPPFAFTAGRPLFSTPKATVDSGLRVEQPLFDATIDAQGALEQASLAEQQARVRTTLFALRQQVNDAFFAAAGFEGRRVAVSAAVADLSARLNETNTRVREGAALPADAAAIEAALLQRQQEQEEMRVARRVALTRLAILTGQTIADGDTLALPDVRAVVARARQGQATVRARPEYDLFAKTGDRLAQQRQLTLAQERPRVSTFAQVGYARPGLNFVSDEFETYGLGGVRVQWNAWTWGRGDRARAALEIQRQIVAADEAAFAKGLDQAVDGDAATVDRLQATLAVDDRIIALREQVERSTRVRFGEGVVTASELVDRSTELLQARSARASHEVELAQAGARLLTTLGLEVR